MLVTASVDEISLRHAISINADISISGSVVWTGTSSLDIRMALQQQHHKEPSLEALFSFVHLHPDTRKPAPIPQVGASAGRLASSMGNSAVGVALVPLCVRGCAHE